MNITDTIVRRAAPYKAVAFDVFDTLLKRDVAKPTDLFRLCGKEFAVARIQAENRARAAAQGEVTLADIYAQPELAGYDPAVECSLELKAAVPYLPVQAAVRQLRRQGKRVYFISDMYLPPEQVTSMLTRCGYEPFDGGFVSSSYGVQKRSGALFRRFLRETGLKSNQVLFVGDSWRADVAGAALAGIRSWHLPQSSVPAVPQRDTFVPGAVQAFVENRVEGFATPGQALGFAVLGPLLVAFCQWLHQCRQQRGGGRLFFLARDMYLTRELYERLYPGEQTYYLQVSRRSLCPALLARRSYELLTAALPRQQLTGSQIAAYCGAACPDAWKDKLFDLKHPGAEDGLSELLDALQPPPDGLLALEYLHSTPLQAGDLLVDIGSGGTTQILLEALCGFPLTGLQLSGDERLSRLPADRTEVFLSLDGEQTVFYWAGQPMLERMISQDTGATLGYVRQGTQICVRREEHTPSPMVEELQQGARAFAEAWQESVLGDCIIPPAAAIEPFFRLLTRPISQETALLGDLSVEDGGIYPLAAPRSLGQYLRHPAQAGRDLSEARWKIGFLKRLLRWPLPYDRLYLALKK